MQVSNEDAIFYSDNLNVKDYGMTFINIMKTVKHFFVCVGDF